MAEIKWIKLMVDTFDDEKIRLIQNLPEGDALVLIWLRLLTLAAKCNAGGYVYLSKKVAYTTDMLAALFGKTSNLVSFALNTYRAFGMIDIDENGYIWIENWGKHQNVDGMEKVREQGKLRQRKHREKKKNLELAGANTPLLEPASEPEPIKNQTSGREKSNVTVPLRNAIEEERRKKKEEVKEKKILSSNLDEIEQIISFLNKKADRAFGNSQANRKDIQARMRKGASIEEFKLVIDWKVSEWGNDAKMKKYLTPTTLFRATNFDRYLDEAREELKKRGKDVERIIASYREDRASSPFAERSGTVTDSYFGHLVK